jgi:hypothetical protein
MSEPTDRKSRVRKAIVHETQQLVEITLFLAAFFVALTTYRRLLLAEYNIGYFEYGYAIVEALVLAKVILIGEALGLGERYAERPLMVPVLWKTLVFGILIAIFSLLEHFVGARVHGEPLASALPSLKGPRGYELLARVMVTLIALVPLLAFRETERVLGEGKLFDLFFRRRGPSPTLPTR